MLARRSEAGYVPDVQGSMEPRLGSRAKSLERALEETRHGFLSEKLTYIWLPIAT